jgi:hypothetical protein
MKKVLAMLLCMGFIITASGSILVQKKSAKKSSVDTTAIKSKVPQKQIQIPEKRIQKTKHQELELQKSKLWIPDQPLLMKEKDTLHNKAK